MLAVLDLFSGIGGFSLGLERTGGFRTAMFCEIDPYCRAVLARHWPDVPIHHDIRTLSDAAADVVCGGFPCQDISYAGCGGGIDGIRSGLWREMLRIVSETKPRWVIVENVAALRNRGLDRLLRAFAEIGYDARWDCLPASWFGSPQLRERLWLVAYAAGRFAKSSGASSDFVELESCFLQARVDTLDLQTESEIPRVVDAVPNRLDRLRCIGNAVVPQVVEAIGRAILEAEANP